MSPEQERRFLDLKVLLVEVLPEVERLRGFTLPPVRFGMGALGTDAIDKLPLNPQDIDYDLASSAAHARRLP